MAAVEALARIKQALGQAPDKSYLAEMHIQVIKYAAELHEITGREFCDAVGVNRSFGTEYSKMKKISARLVAAGLEVEAL